MCECRVCLCFWHSLSVSFFSWLNHPLSLSSFRPREGYTRTGWREQSSRTTSSVSILSLFHFAYQGCRSLLVLRSFSLLFYLSTSLSFSRLTLLQGTSMQSTHSHCFHKIYTHTTIVNDARVYGEHDRLSLYDVLARHTQSGKREGERQRAGRLREYVWVVADTQIVHSAHLLLVTSPRLVSFPFFIFFVDVRK